MANLDAASFALQVDSLIDKMNGGADALVRRIALEIWNEITKRTPVDTGRARAAWMASIDSPSTKNFPEGTYAAPSEPDLSEATIKNLIYVTNNVDYIQHLEEGTSKQAPAGMVRVTLAQVRAELETLIAKNAGTNS